MVNAIAEVINAVYNDVTERIELVTAFVQAQEVDPVTEDSLPGDPVDNQRWVRQVSQTFVSEQLEVRSQITTELTPASTEADIADVSRFPNRGEVRLDRGTPLEEAISYEERDLINNKLLDIGAPTNTHLVGAFVTPNVQVSFLGTYELELLHCPIRTRSVSVTLNGVVQLKEGVDFEIINTFDGITCTRGQLRFASAGQPRRFRQGDFVEVTYQYFDQTINSIKINSSFGETTFVDVYNAALFELRFDELQAPDREVSPRGNFKITPPLSGSSIAPTPATVVIPDITLPVNLTLEQDISPANNGGDIQVSSVEGLPRAGTLFSDTDDTLNRSVTISGETLFYNDTDITTNRLLGVIGISSSHQKGDELTFNGARFIRDTIKNAINANSDIRNQIEAAGIDVDDQYFLQISSKVAGAAFNLQPGTYSLSFLGFNDDLQRGLHEGVTTLSPFINKDFTFRRFQDVTERQGIAASLIGETVTQKVEVSPGRAEVM